MQTACITAWRDEKEITVRARLATCVFSMLLCHAWTNAMALDLQGHRGARGLAPENTLAGFALALSTGITTLELDIAITRDGVLVVSHDPRLNPDITRGPDGRFLESPGLVINQLTFAELQRYDVGRLKPGTDYAKRYPQQRAEDGARVPRLSDVFALVRKAGNDDVRFAIETKVTPFNPEETPDPETFARAVIAAIREAGMAQRSTILSFDWRTLAVVQREAPEIGTVYLTAQQRWLDNIGVGQPAGSAWTNGIQYNEYGSVPRMIKAAGGRIWSAFFGDLDSAKVKEARELGIEVLAWTVNAPADIVRVLDLGVDGIVSDRPDLVRDEMKRRGLPLPSATPVKH
jgi:glycerophosphoryl diester phosphodiesterase